MMSEAEVYRGYSIASRDECYIAIPADNDGEAEITIVGNTLEAMRGYIDMLWESVDSGGKNIPAWMQRWMDGHDDHVYPEEVPTKPTGRLMVASRMIARQAANTNLLFDACFERTMPALA